MYISVNGKIVDYNDYNISPISEAFLYGYGLFETIKVYNGKLYFFGEHIERMKAGCVVLDLQFKLNINKIKKNCEELIKTNDLDFGAIRLSYSKNKNDYYILITTRNIPYTEKIYEKGFKICFSDTKRNHYSPLVYVKSNNYLENILARKKALDKGYDEAVFLNIHDKICEGTISNIFFVKNDEIYTPSVKCGILEGIIRNKVIEIINNNNFNINFGEYEKELLYDADEIFITNSLMNIMPVAELEGKEFDLEKNKITRFLMKELSKIYR